MKKHLFSGFASIQIAAAAPSVDMPEELVVPLESASGYALVDKTTGQVRFHLFDFATNALTEIGPTQTYLPNVTGLSSGFSSGGVEHVILSSVSSNRLSFAPVNSGSPVAFRQQVPGPQSAIPLNEPGKATAALVHSIFGSEGHGLEMSGKAATSPALLDLVSGGLAPLTSMQSFRNPDLAGAHMGVALYKSSSPPFLLEFSRDTSDIQIDSVIRMGSSSHLTTEVIGADGRFCTIGWVPGEATSEIVTHGFLGFREALSPPTPDPGFGLGFRIGTMTPVSSGLPGAPDGGVLITALDGSAAYYALVINGQRYSLMEKFLPSQGKSLNALIPIPGIGILVLEGIPNSRVTTDWRLFRNSGATWKEVKAGALGPWLAPTEDFATLFWFKGTPLVDPFAELLKLERVSDWTNGGGSLPATLSRETFGSTTEGLDDPAGITLSAPVGSDYVLTSQYQENVSVSALADNLTLSTPSLSLSPPSGTYAGPVTISALYDDATLDILYREDRPDTSWQLLTKIPLTVGYPSTWLFHARESATGTAGPIVTRNYQFSVDPNTVDSDGDTVPDYVERESGLDPAAGADTDGDFRSDLEELLDGTDPTDPDSFTPQDLRNPPYLGEGFHLYAQAYTSRTDIAAPYNDGGTPTTLPVADQSAAAIERADDTPGTKLNAADMRSTLLGTGEVALIQDGSLTGRHAARIDVSAPLPAREWLILSSPAHFNLGTSSNPPRNGRETFRVMKRPALPVASIPFVPSNTDRTTDAAGWVAAALTAHDTFEPVTTITRLDPEDNAIAALAEQATFASLSTLLPAEKAALEIPSVVTGFTLFGLRDGEAGKVKLSAEMIEALFASGYDFTAMIDLLDTGARASTNIQTLSNVIYARHTAISEITPNMALPLDALRSIIRTGNIRDPGSTVALSYTEEGEIATTTSRPNPYETVSAALRAAAKADIDTLLAGIETTRRPIASWMLTIEPPTTPGHRYDYRRNTGSLAWLIDSFEDRFILEQGLGLNHGTVFTVTGYTDVDPVPGFDTLEIISIDSVIIPKAADNDSNANLLDDEWEQFFFGSIGLVNPHDLHPLSGHSYLQYHLTGADPRAGTLSDPILNLLPSEPQIVWVPANNAYDIQFSFPDAYFANFEFSLLSSTSLTGFAGPVDVGTVDKIAPNRYALHVSEADSVLERNFFKIAIALATP